MPSVHRVEMVVRPSYPVRLEGQTQTLIKWTKLLFGVTVVLYALTIVLLGATIWHRP